MTEAALRIFDRQEWLRANRARARIKVLIDKIGIDAFQRAWSRRSSRATGSTSATSDLEPLLFEDDEEAQRAAAPRQYGSAQRRRSRVRALRSPPTSVPQRQEGFSAVEVKVTRGDLTPEQFRGLAQIMRDFTGGYARTTVHQNLVLRWVRDESLYDVWQRLERARPRRRRRDEITDVVSCPGTDSCKLGITSSMGLNRAFRSGSSRCRSTTR